MTSRPFPLRFTFSRFTSLRFAFYSLLLCASALSSPAATITGNLTDISLGPLNTTLQINPTNIVLVNPLGLSAGPPATIATTNGSFSVVLDAGDYTICLPLVQWRNCFTISVPTGTNTYNITNLLVAPQTYTYTNNLNYTLKAMGADAVPDFLDGKLAVAGTLSKLYLTNAGAISLVLSNPVNSGGQFVKQGTNTLFQTNANEVTIHALSDTNVVRAIGDARYVTRAGDNQTNQFFTSSANSVVPGVATNLPGATTNLWEFRGTNASSAFGPAAGLHIGALTPVGASNLVVEGTLSLGGNSPGEVIFWTTVGKTNGAGIGVSSSQYSNTFFTLPLGPATGVLHAQRDATTTNVNLSISQVIQSDIDPTAGGTGANFNGAHAGFVPIGDINDTTNFLRKDGTFAVPSGGGGGASAYTFTAGCQLATLGSSTTYYGGQVGISLNTSEGIRGVVTPPVNGTIKSWSFYGAVTTVNSTSATADFYLLHTNGTSFGKFSAPCNASTIKTNITGLTEDVGPGEQIEIKVVTPASFGSPVISIMATIVVQ